MHEIESDTEGLNPELTAIIAFRQIPRLNPNHSALLSFLKIPNCTY